MSGEVRGQWRQDPPRYVVMDFSESLGNRQASNLLWGSLAETYQEGGCELHVHFRAGFVGGGVAGDWCAIFNRVEDWLDFVRNDAHRHDVTETRGGEPRRVGQPVRVDVGKLVELPQGIVPEPLPSVVRLQPLDLCLRGWGDAPKRVLESAQVLSGEDGEHGFLRELARQPLPPVGGGKVEGEVVERSPQAMQTIPDDEAKVVSGWGVEDFDPKELLAGINVRFGPCSVRAFFLPGSNFGFKALQVVERPVEPSLVVEGHGR